MNGNADGDHGDTDADDETHPGDRGFDAEIVCDHQGIQEPIQGLIQRITVQKKLKLFWMGI